MSLTAQEFIRYNRHIMVEQIGEQGQLKLKRSRVAIIGMGGLGCPAAQYLVASGVGALTIIDNDEIELSNLQRQILYTSDDIGKAKVSAAKQALTAINPDCQIETINKSIFELDIDMLLDNVDLVLDCTDNPKTRLYINQSCVNAGVFLVSASAIQGAGQLVSFDFSLPNSPCYQCIFPEAAEQSLNCSTSGVLSPLLGIMGSFQATEAIRLLLGMSNNLNKLTLVDAWSMDTRSFKVVKAASCNVCSK